MSAEDEDRKTTGTIEAIICCVETRYQWNLDFKVRFDLEGQGQSTNHQNNMDLNQGVLHRLEEFGGSILNQWWLIARTSKAQNGSTFLLNLNLTLMFNVNGPPKHYGSWKGVLHFWSIFGDSNLSGWKVITLKNSELTVTKTHVQTDTGNDNTRKPKLSSGKNPIYHQTSNIRGTSMGNEILDHSDVVGASPAGAAPTASSFLT